MNEKETSPNSVKLIVVTSVGVDLHGKEIQVERAEITLPADAEVTRLMPQAVRLPAGTFGQ